MTITTAATAGLHALQIRGMAGNLWELATQAIEDGKVQLGIRHLQSYVALRPSDLNARIRLIELRRENASSRSDYLALWKSYEDILRRDANQHDVRRQLVELLVAFGRHDDAVQHFDILRPHASDDVELLMLFAHCLEEQRDYSAAIDMYQEVIAKAPNRIPAYERLAARWINDEKPQRAREVYDLLVRKNQRDGRAYLSRAEYRTRSGQYEEAKADIAVARQLSPDDPRVQVSAIELAYHQRDDGVLLSPSTHRTLVALAVRFPDRTRIHGLLSRIEAYNGNLIEATRWCRVGLEEAPQNVSLRLQLIDVLLARKELSEAQKEVAAAHSRIEALVKQDHRDTRLTVLQGLLDVSVSYYQHDWNTAAQACESLRVKTGDRTILDRLDEWLSVCYQELGRPQAQAEVCNRFLRRHPLSAKVRRRLAHALAARGHIDEAVDQFRLALGRQSTQWTHTGILTNLARCQQDAVAARQFLDRAERVPNLSTSAVLARVACLSDGTILTHDSRNDRIDGLREVEQTVTRMASHSRRAILERLAWAYHSHREVDGAKRVWSRLSRRETDDLQLQSRCFLAALDAGDDALMDQCIRSLGDIEGPDGPAGQFCRASRFVRTVEEVEAADRANSPHLQTACRLLDATVDQRPEWSAAWRQRGRVHELAGRLDAAISDYKQAFERGCLDQGTLLTLVELLQERQEFAVADRMLRDYESRSGLRPDKQAALLASHLAFRAGDTPRALRLARASIVGDPTNHAAHLWLGKLLAAMNKPHEAEDALQTAIALDAHDVDTWHALLSLLITSRSTSNLDPVLETARQSLAPDTRRTLALRLSNGAFDEFQIGLTLAEGNKPLDQLFRARMLASRPFGKNAEEARQLLAGLRSDSVELTFADHVLLARLHEVCGDLKAASVSWRQVMRDHPAEPSVWSQYVAWLISHGQFGRADEILVSLPESHDVEDLAQRQLLSAAIFIHKGKIDRALRTLDNLVNAAPPEVTADRMILAATTLASLATTITDRKVRQRLLSAADRRYRKLVQERPRARLDYVDFLLRQQRPRDAMTVCQDAMRESAGKNAYEVGQIAHLALRVLRVYDRPLARSDTSQASSAMKALGQSVDRFPEKEYVKRWIADRCAEHPDSVRTQFAIAQLRDWQQQYQEAETAYRRVLELDSRHAPALNNLAWMLCLRGGHSKETMGLIERAITVAGPTANLLDTKGLIELTNGEVKAASQSLRSSLETEDNPVTRFHLALAHLQVPDEAAARRALEEAVNQGLRLQLLHPLERDRFRNVLASVSR